MWFKYIDLTTLFTHTHILAVNGRRPCCSRTNREELYRLNCFADHMSLMKKLFCVESGLDTRSFLKNEGNHSTFAL
jgi:hypothetical protein